MHKPQHADDGISCAAQPQSLPCPHRTSAADASARRSITCVLATPRFRIVSNKIGYGLAPVFGAEVKPEHAQGDHPPVDPTARLGKATTSRRYQAQLDGGSVWIG